VFNPSIEYVNPMAGEGFPFLKSGEGLRDDFLIRRVKGDFRNGFGIVQRFFLNKLNLIRPNTHSTQAMTFV